MNEQLNAAKERLRTALLNGEDPKPHRQAIERLEADYARRLNEQASEESMQASSRAEAIATRTDGILSEILARLQLVCEALPTFSQQSADADKIRYLVHGIADAEMRLHDARAKHIDATAKANDIQARIDAVAVRKEELRAKLKNGELTDKEAGALLAVADDDLVDLRSMHAEAISAANAMKPTVEESIYNQALTALNQGERKIAVDIAHAHILACEVALIESLRQSAAILQAAKMSPQLHYVWRPSSDLQMVMRTQSLPSPRRHG